MVNCTVRFLWKAIIVCQLVREECWTKLKGIHMDGKYMSAMKLLPPNQETASDHRSSVFLFGYNRICLSQMMPNYYIISTFDQQALDVKYN